MSIKDFFSHKIHSSGAEWPDKLIELATLFHEFDGQLYDRDAIEQRLAQISPRASFVARDKSKFRDEYSAYPAYFGLYQLIQSPNGWVIKTSETTKQFLLNEEPDPAAFLRLQLTLFQYPNGMGVAYYKGANNLRIQANTRDRTVGFIKHGVHLSPLRLISLLLLADAQLRSVSLTESYVTYDEIFALANQSAVNQTASPDLQIVINHLKLARTGKISPPQKYERRFHLLKHVDLFKISRGKIQLRDCVSEADFLDVESKIITIGHTTIQFSAFDQISTGEQLVQAIGSGLWGTYFDGLRTLRSDIVRILAGDIALTSPTSVASQPTSSIEINPITYPLRKRADMIPTPQRSTRKRTLADPEVTKIKRQRRNLIHKLLVEQMDDLLRDLGAEPMESSHIDLYAQIPDDGSFIFEMKSGGQNLLPQIRKGLSQLYEYRFRYKPSLHQPITLCMVLAEEPNSLPWITEYLCVDREIALCWFDQNGNLQYPQQCAEQMQQLNI